VKQRISFYTELNNHNLYGPYIKIILYVMTFVPATNTAKFQTIQKVHRSSHQR